MCGARSCDRRVAILSGPMGAACLNGALGRGGDPRLAGHPVLSVRSAVWGTPDHASLSTTSNSTPLGGSKSVGGGGLLTVVLGGRAGPVV